VSATDAAASIPDGATIALTGSGGGILEADDVFQAIEQRFLATGHPRNLTLVHGLGIGDGEKTGLSRFAHEGLVARVIGGHWSWSPRMQALASANLIEAYSLPAGIIATLLRESGAHRPGVFSKVGLGTFVDPRRQGGRLNDRAQDEIVTVALVDGEEYLHYKPIIVNVAIVRGSSIDTAGNLSSAGEAATLDSRAVATAARGCGGQVIAQAKRLAAIGEQDARMINVPGPLVDMAVISPGQWQTYAAEHEASFTQAAPLQEPRVTTHSRSVGPREIIARRASLEVNTGDVLNVGFGISAGVVDVLAEQGRLNEVQLVIEQGAVGGEPETGALFGLSRHPQAVLSSSAMFDIFATGMLDLAVLGMAQVDRFGNVNASKVGDSVVGPGGFIDIATYAKKLVFCGTFTTRGLTAGIRGGELRIDREGALHKFVAEVTQVTFDAKTARERGQSALFVTERAVFELHDHGLELTEVAPGLDLQTDVLDQMDFRPLVNDPRPMPSQVFLP